MRRVGLVAGVLLISLAAPALARLPVSRLAAGSGARDCLGSLDVLGTTLRPAIRPSSATTASARAIATAS